MVSVVGVVVTKQRSASRDQETWLRRHGLALLIPGRRRLPRVLSGATPLLVFLIVALAGIAMVDNAFGTIENVDAEDVILTGAQTTQFFVGLGIAVLALPAAIGYQFWQRHRSRLTQTIGAAIVAVVWLGGLSLLGLGLDYASIEGMQVTVTDRLVVMACAYLVVYFELPSIIRWAGSRVWSELRMLAPMIARVLPFLLLAQLLVFFTNEIWQLAYSLSSVKMWLVNGILIVPIVLLVVSDTRNALRQHLNRGEPFRPELLAGTPFEGLPDAGRRTKLAIGETVNLVLLPLVAQLIQIALFIGLLCVFFVCFGAVALNPALIAEWTNKPAVRMVWLGINLPIDRTMFRVSLILAVFSGLSFAASNATDESYRKIFLAPIIDEMELNLAARHVYRGRA